MSLFKHHFLPRKKSSLQIHESDSLDSHLEPDDSSHGFFSINPKAVEFEPILKEIDDDYIEFEPILNEYENEQQNLDSNCKYE
ncbi:hypothetical protein L2E82_40148 [Cichorium intybus]|uniref:Uncharacterized protein n=1 Tax=Cichorium intybus TaxID=13427 RepID=A0ACB9AJG1_CICIN|nr:hypothetical protein L2E82_40148 [Cichorium intybus]